MTEEQNVGAATRVLYRCVSLSEEESRLKKELETVQEELKAIKEQVKNLFIEMGVKSMKAGKTIYLNRQYWAGTAEGATSHEVSKALERLDLAQYVTYNHQSLSAYVREQAKQCSELIGSEGEIIATPEQILAILPEPLNKLLKVSEVIDIRVKK